jgi:hypothetical protein
MTKTQPVQESDCNLSVCKISAEFKLPSKQPLVSQLHISLLESSPLIWRRVLVPSGITLGTLHKVLQVVMGWEDCHSHEYLFDGEAYTVPDPDIEFGRTLRDERRKKLSSLLKSENDTLRYLYDPGDGWVHAVTLEKILPEEKSLKTPRCIEGEGACPPENCGGISGYAELLKVLDDPDHPHYREKRAWAGGRFDPGRFDPKVVNRRLAEKGA